MSLRKYDDWDEALDEAYWNAVARGEIELPKPPRPMTLADYGASITINVKELLVFEDPGE